MRALSCLVASALLTLGVASRARATVLFESKGVKKDWDSFTSPDQVTEVQSPVYGTGPTGLRMLQKFSSFGSYHCEVRKHEAMKVGQDLYFGEAMQLPGNWIFHDQNVTFQQFARSDVFASPWALVFIQRDHLYAAFDGSGLGQNDLGSVANLQGTWIRLVIRLRLLASGGVFETWINGTKTASVNVNYDKGGPGVRWSVGMYCTYWRREKPAGLDPMILFHDQMRIATTMEEADPASWSGVTPPPPPADAGGASDAAPPAKADAAADSAAADAATAGTGGSAPPDAATAGAGGSGGYDAGAAGNQPTRPGSGGSGTGTGGARGREPDPVDPPPPAHASGGCALAVAGLPPRGLTLAMVSTALLTLLLRRQRRPSR
jgi:hypothetical protein